MGNIKCLLFLLLFLLTPNSFPQEIKKYEFAGLFYPLDKDELNRTIDRFMSQAIVPDIKGQILGIICPHAGYIYSGPIAAYSYKSVEGRLFDTVILLGPSHRYYFEGVSVYPEGFFDTPFGKLEIDKDMAGQLNSLSFVKFETKFFYGEHSLEVQLPFLVKVLPRCKIVPMLFGRLDFEQMKTLADNLASLAKKKRILLVVSTDLSHFHPYSQAKGIDLETIKYIEDNNASWLWRSVQMGEQRACGILSVITFALYMKEQGGNTQIIKYANSGDTAGDESRVVGYVSAVGYVKKRGVEKEGTMELTKEEKITLLNIARKTLEDFLKDKKRPHFEVDSDRLKEKRAVFVTLKKLGELRGCIGRIVADTPLYETVSKVAIDSALNDPRFRPVMYEELKDIEIEISVMTPFEKIEGLEEIEVGKHGLMIKKGFYSGLLLPQVPTEYGWDKKTYLEHLCYKAGLESNAYKDKDTIIYKFSAEVFSESEIKD